MMRKLTLFIFLFATQISFSQNIELKGKMWWVSLKKAKSDLEIGEVYEMFPDSSNRKSIDNTMLVEENLFFNDNDEFYYTLKGSFMNPHRTEPNLQYSNSGKWKLKSPDVLEITMEDGEYNRSIYTFKINIPEKYKTQIILTLIEFRYIEN